MASRHGVGRYDSSSEDGENKSRPACVALGGAGAIGGACAYSSAAGAGGKRLSEDTCCVLRRVP